MGVLVLLWGLLLGRGIWCLTGPSRVSVRVGGRLTVRCVYDEGFQDYIKYWCKGESSKYCDVQIKTEGSAEVSSGRLIIKDNPSSRSFTVTIKDVRYYDDEIYYCGIERNARDNMHMVTVDVLPGACQVTNPWTDIVDFPSTFTELEVSSVVEVSCQGRYKKKNIMLQCREKSGGIVLSPRSHSDYCVGVCRKASPWTHMVDFPENFTEISVNSSVVVSCQQGYREKNITLQCWEKSGQFLLSPADGDTPCVGVCRKASPWTHMVDFPENFTEISVNSSVVVSCQTGYREKNITLQCREESGQFLLSPADGDHCTGVCRKASPWTHMVDFPENFTEISVNSSVVVSCQQGYREKNITLQCREESGQFLLSPADGDHCTGSGDSSKSGYILGPSSTAASSSPCPDPWILITNKCYLFSENKKTRRASEEDCEKRGSRLATVKEGTILKLVAITEQEFWIGLEALGSHHRGGWSGRWADGSTVNVTEETGTCAKIKSKLSLHNCMEELHWICERDVTAP